jgi:hypothetical protein
MRDELVGDEITAVIDAARQAPQLARS